MDEPAAPVAADARLLSARGLGLTLPFECEVGVAANLALLADHAAIVRATLAEVAGAQ
jgi:hypothetical protein